MKLSDRMIYALGFGGVGVVVALAASLFIAPAPADVNNPVNVRGARKAVAAVYFSGRPADGDLLTIDGRKYEVDKDASFPDSGGDYCLDMQAAGGLDDDLTIAETALNADSARAVDAVKDLANDVLWLYALTPGSGGNALTLAETLANATISGATFADGADGTAAQLVAIRHTITTNEAAAGYLRFDTGLSSIESVVVGFEDAGNVVASQVDISISGGAIGIAENGVAWANGDVLNVIAVGTE